ncbi:MAG: class I SAM-dependent methyltransferase [Spirochaetales bacterium]|nr:class I SAM-dependent methyltransferase [Spirochaetales bacterium]
MVLVKHDYYKKKSKQAFNRQAAYYDHDKNGSHARTMYPYILDKINNLQFKNILDIGCGTGEILSAVADYNGVRAYGIDISLKMLSVAETKIVHKAQLMLGDAEKLPYGDCFFDVVICNDSFHHYPNPLAVLLEMRRVLKAGGTLLLSDICLPNFKRVLLNMFIYLSPDGDYKIYSRNAIRNLVKQAGFVSGTYEKVNDNGFIVCAHT